MDHAGLPYVRGAVTVSSYHRRSDVRQVRKLLRAAGGAVASGSGKEAVGFGIDAGAVGG